MSANSVTSTSEDYYTPSDKKESTSGTDDVSKDAFMKLLVAQMTNQDPLEPVSNENFLTQMAQFQTLEEQRSMSDSMDSLTASMSLFQSSNKDLLQQLVDSSGTGNENMLIALQALRMESSVSSASAMIGKYVLGTTTEGKDVTGLVKSVRVANTIPYVVLEDGTEVPLMNVSKVDTAAIELPATTTTTTA